MSKMPAKKKSCFQITSVTQAQVAAIGAGDDTESLDDPDESRTEDVSSEIYDMSRAEYEPACDRSSSEEALNNVGEAEVASVNAPPGAQLSAPSNNSAGEFRKVGVSGTAPQQTSSGVTPGVSTISQPGPVQQHQPTSASTVSVNPPQNAAATTAAPSPATSTVSCTSRFRVIKLDHGTGEPFRRGRWTCTEFYEKESEGTVVSRTVDSIRHGSAMLDADRDSGVGLTGGSVAAPAALSGQALGSTADTSIASPRMHSAETPPQQVHHQSYSARQQGVSSSVTHSAFSNVKPAVNPVQTQVGSVQPLATQNLLPVGQNGLSQSSVHLQKSPILPPSAQPITYPPPPQQQVPVSHHLTSQSSGHKQNQTEFYQQQQSTSMPGHTTSQTLPVSSFPAVPAPVGQGNPSIMPPSSGGASVPSQVGDVATGGKAAPSAMQHQAAGIVEAGGSMLVGAATLPQSVSAYATTGQPQPQGHPTSSGVQNVPAFTVSSSVPPTVPTAVPSASSAAMPNVMTSSLPLGQIPHSKTPVALGTQMLPASGFGLIEGIGGRKSDGLVNAQSAVVSGKEPVKHLMPESLQLTTPTVNSLFGIHIPVDGDEDSASGTNIVAIDNKIEQAMDLVKSHLMYAVREEVEVLKEQIKELFERNSVLERENAVLKSLANSEQLSQLSTQSAGSSAATPPQQGLAQPQPPPPQQQQQQQQQPQQQQQQQQPSLQVQPQPHPQLQQHPKAPQPQTQPQLDPSQQQQLQPNVTSA